MIVLREEGARIEGGGERKVEDLRFSCGGGGACRFGFGKLIGE